MLIQQKLGSLNNQSTTKTIDWLELEWYETNKRILRKQTKSGKEISLKFLNESPNLTQGDILFEDEQTIIAVNIQPCDCIVIKPNGLFEMASVCYEIGNKHLPLFFEKEEVLVPFEAPLFYLLTAQGYNVKQEHRKLLQLLKTTVAPHGFSSDSSISLFSAITKLSTSAE